ncbi:MAG TPA: hypothetical protein PK878_07315 [bacterium]|nr:hypothetical protein [bacterium]
MNFSYVFYIAVTLTCTGFLTATPPLGAEDQGSLLAEFTADDPVAVSGLPEGVTVMLEPETSADGQKSWRLTYSGNEPVFAALFEVPLAGIENGQLQYSARLRSRQVSGRAYLEMRCVFPDGKSYFAKALNETLTGDRDWMPTSTPFFLKKGESPEKAMLGVCLEGPGTVWIDQVRLSRQSLGVGNPFTMRLAWIPGMMLGMLGGIYGAFAGFLAPRGRGRAWVLGLGIFLDGACFLMLTAGIVLFAGGYSFGVWYPWLLTGAIGVLVFTSVLPVIFKRYREAELRRMDALDLS